jgi:hypothetical protein
MIWSEVIRGFAEQQRKHHEFLREQETPPPDGFSGQIESQDHEYQDRREAPGRDLDRRLER